MQTTSTPTTYTRLDIILMLIHRPADAEIPALDQPATFDEVNELIRPLIGRVHASEFVRLSGRQAERLRTEKRPITRASLERILMATCYARGLNDFARGADIAAANAERASVTGAA